MTTTTRTRNFKKNPHTARFLMTFHAGTNGLASDIEETTVVEDLLNSVPVDAPAYQPTAAQRALINKLIAELKGMDDVTGAQAAEYTAKRDENNAWTRKRTTQWIGNMIAKVRELKASETSAAPVEIEDGIYLLDGDVIKVVHAVHGSGRQYGKKLVAPEAPGENGSWERVPGVVARLTPAHKMDLATAEKLGAIYSVCVRCAKTLTKESSIAQAMGDTCASKF